MEDAQDNDLNIRVAHNFADLKEGQTITLNLQDQNILDEKGEINEEIVLENQDMIEQDKREHRKTMSTKNQQKMYHEQKFLEDRTVLAKYDEITYKKEGFRLDTDGNMIQDAKSTLDLIKQKLKSKKKETFTADSGPNVLASEYVEETEEQRRKKRKGFQKRQQKGKEKKANLAQFLEENIEEDIEKDHMNNHGNRDENTQKRKREQAKEELLEKKSKLENYEQAVNDANLQSKKAQEKWIFNEEDDMEQQLFESLEQQRKKKQEDEKEQIKDKNSNKKGEVENRVLDILKENEEVEKQNLEAQRKQIQDQQSMQMPKPKKKGMKNQEYISELNQNQDFLKNVDTDEQSKNQYMRESQFTAAVGDSRKGTASIVQTPLPSERQMGWKRRQDMIDAQIPDMNLNLTKEEIQKLNEEVEFLKDEDLGKGTMGALKILREQGVLQNYDFIGRNKDELPETADQNGERIKLEYRDESGKLMTQKEAFRYMCHIFHGKGVSKKTLEKKQKKLLVQEQLRQKQTANDSVLMEQLKLTQNQSSQAHMFINLNRPMNRQENQK